MPVSQDHKRILLITSRKFKGCLVFPKGGLKRKEKAIDAALRECWEETGAVGKVLYELPIAKHEDAIDPMLSPASGHDLPEGDEPTEGPGGQGQEQGQGQRQRWFVLEVTGQAVDFPERGQRELLWKDIGEARKMKNLRPITRILIDKLLQTIAP